MKLYRSIVLLIIVGSLLAACAPATPQVVEKVVKETVVVQTEKVVQQTVIVEQTKVVEKEVVTATPVPPTVVPVAPKDKQIGGTLNIWLPNGWPDKSWAYLSNWESWFAVSPMAEGLFWPRPDGTLEPLLATSATASADALVWTVKLRVNVLWHDGQPFTADDVAYSIVLHANPKLKPLGWIYSGLALKDYVNYNQGKADSITGIKVIDPLTIQFTLDTPDGSFPRTFLTGSQMPIMPKHVLEKLDQAQVLDNTAAYWYTAPIGTGPYKFVSYKEDQYIEYARNDSYWGGKVGPDKLFMKISSPEVASIMIQKGELDYMYPTNLTEVNLLKATPGIELVEAKNSATYFGLVANTTTMNGAWRDPKIKQAFLTSVNRQGYVDTILQGFGQVRDSPFDGSAYACPTMTRWTYDPAKADQLWTAAGWPKDKRSTWAMDFMSWLGNKPRLDYLPIVQEAMRTLGFKANVDLIDNSLEPTYYNAGPRGRDWDMRVAGWGPAEDPQGMSSLADPNSGANAWMLGCPDGYDTVLSKDCPKYNNPRVSELFALTAKETDPAKRTAYFQEIDCIWNLEQPQITTAGPSFILTKSTRLQGVDWANGASLGWWMALYKPGDLWIWDTTKK